MIIRVAYAIPKGGDYFFKGEKYLILFLVSFRGYPILL